MRLDVALEPVGKGLVVVAMLFERRVGSGQRFIVGRGEVLRDPVQLLDGQRGGTVLDVLPFLFDLGGEGFGTFLPPLPVPFPALIRC